METVRRHPVIAYFVLAYVLTWWMFPLLRYSPLLGPFGLFGPALAAIIMAGVLDGRSGVKALLKRVVRWRVGVRWYLVALGLPALLLWSARSWVGGCSPCLTCSGTARLSQRASSWACSGAHGICLRSLCRERRSTGNPSSPSS